jgi:hypothetical protein
MRQIRGAYDYYQEKKKGNKKPALCAGSEDNGYIGEGNT